MFLVSHISLKLGQELKEDRQEWDSGKGVTVLKTITNSCD